MSISMQPKYDPRHVEDTIYARWENNGYFSSVPIPGKREYCIVIPPPNVTGVLHMGHALNNSLQDILIRWRRMQGFETLWLPGTDHAGIATQHVVDMEIASEGLSRHDLGRPAFVERVWKWREKYGSRILTQLKKLGCSCDWDRERFTLDEGLSRAVNTVFVTLYREGLIYRGNYLINWCPSCLTALSDDEVEHIEKPGRLWYLRYPFAEGGGYIVVATTRPETMLGDTAVAVNPNDERFKHIIGRNLRLPFVDREIPVIADSAVDPEFGTGCVKVTPAHDHNDYAMGNRHNLPRVVIMTDHAIINENGAYFNGMNRYECRKKLVAAMYEKNLIEKEEDYNLNLSVCYRCDTAIEPYLSDQWFVKMRPLAEPALEAARSGQVRFHPDRWVRVYNEWLENVRDWCISRQIWWGHPIPVWYCDDCTHVNVALEEPERCELCNHTSLTRDEDVLDTWFSSALWPFSTLGWPDETEDLKYYYPTNTLVTARGIIYFWVARMVMMGLKFRGEVPFTDVLIHGTILDEIGRRMSKSLGNGIDPLEMIDIYGADAVRFSLVMLTTEGQDVKLSPKRFEMGRNFTNKIWNAVRFALMKMPENVEMEGALDHNLLSIYDKWILTRLSKTIETVTMEQEQFRLNHAITAIYTFFWNDLCDWYLEAIKADLSPEAAPERRNTAARIFISVLDAAFRLLHPYMPFLTEEVWSKLNELYPVRNLAGCGKSAESIMIAEWPDGGNYPRFEDAEEVMEVVKLAVGAVRNLRGARNILEKVQLSALYDAGNPFVLSAIEQQTELIVRLANLKSIRVDVNIVAPPNSAAEVIPPIQLYVPLGEILDVNTERERLGKALNKQLDYIASIEEKLSNENFVSRAPAAVVDNERSKLSEIRELAGRIKRDIEALG